MELHSADRADDSTIDLGVLRLERVVLTTVLLLLIYVLTFLAVSRLGLAHGRPIFAFALAGAAGWVFQQWVLPPQLAKSTLDSRALLACFLIVGIPGTVLFVVTSPGYVLAGNDPVIVPTLADGLLSHATTMDIYRPGDSGYAYPPGYPIIFSNISRLVTPLQSLFVFKMLSVVLVTLLPIGWAWTACRIFHLPIPFWLTLMLSYVAVFGLERSATFTLQYGKNAQLLAGVLFPFLAGLLLIAARKNIGIPFAVAAFAGGILLHYSMFYLVITFLVAYVLVHFPRQRDEWIVALRLGLIGLSSFGVFVLLMKPALSDPRGSSFGTPHPVQAIRQIVDILFSEYDEILFIFNGPSFPLWHSPYRGMLLVGCILICLAAANLLRGVHTRASALPRMAGVWGIMWLAGIAFATGAFPVGITPDFTRWYLIFPQAALMFCALCAVAFFAIGEGRAARAASWALGGVAALAAVLAAGDLVHVAGVYQKERISRSDLTNVRDVFGGKEPCFLITESHTMVDGLLTVQHYRPLEYAEILTGCRIANGSFVRRGVPQGRELNGLPTAEALAALPTEANILLVVPQPTETLYQAAIPGVEFVRQQTPIGPLPVWRIRRP
ncbi:MAG: hypothetical protein E7813_03480 [Bradyrhizobium sp.]|uniref:hypothetical protein n=1 Tax=Bradyrhizobium sp. TaxID=376 RepID=UPI001214A96D|nr:hypothetical protein [Bradyrhizobium sp.]THD73089.1 MAG: hypothetical protein E7813_03480 [Bradyrhizobium sp.]